MADLKHTPGPWTTDSEFGTAIIAANGVTVASVLNPINARKSQQPVPTDLDEVRANARLTVAAPEMLDALKAVSSDIHKHQGTISLGTLALVSAAIAKAEGGNNAG